MFIPYNVHNIFEFVACSIDIAIDAQSSNYMILQSQYTSLVLWTPYVWCMLQSSWSSGNHSISMQVRPREVDMDKGRSPPRCNDSYINLYLFCLVSENVIYFQCTNSRTQLLNSIFKYSKFQNKYIFSSKLFIKMAYTEVFKQ